MAKSVLPFAVALLATASPALAQRDRLLVEPSQPTEWGLTFGVTPSWDLVPASLAPLAGLDKDDPVSQGGRSSLKGSDWSIGFARGRAVGGDWGVSFLQRRYWRNSVLDRVQCTSGTYPNFIVVPNVPACDGQLIRLTSMIAIGPEFHVNAPIVTIRDRVQIGLGLAGGIAVVKGTAVVERYETRDQIFGTSPTTVARTVTVTQQEGAIADLNLPKIFTSDLPLTPLGRIEPGVALILSRQVKVAVSAGFNYPGTTTFRVGATYFFPRGAP